MQVGIPPPYVADWVFCHGYLAGTFLKMGLSPKGDNWQHLPVTKSKLSCKNQNSENLVPTRNLELPHSQASLWGPTVTSANAIDAAG